MTRHTRANNTHSVCLALMVDGGKTNDDLMTMKARNILFKTFRPHLGAQSRPEPLNEVQRKGLKVQGIERAKQYWVKHYESSVHQCSHMFWSGRCHNSIAGLACDEGMRRRKYTVISGSIFAVWHRIEHHFRQNQYIHTPRVIRLKTTDGSKIVGVLVPNDAVDDIIAVLREDSGDIKDEDK